MFSSLMVAEKFGKEHKNVLRDIQNLECSQEFTKLNFELSNYKDSTGRKLPMYEMTRDGFTFLAMGFTGKEAGVGAIQPPEGWRLNAKLSLVWG